ncbi:MAG: hypothetical protein ACJATT_000353 [Myxococcota bacterium]|jgi:hypothetical protein
MNPNLCRVELRPRTPLAVFDLTWRLLANRGGPFVRLSLLLLLPVWIVSLPVGWWFDWHWAVALGVWAVGTVLRIPFTLLAGRLMFADDVSVLALLRELLSRWAGMFGLFSLMVVNAVVGVCTCGVSLVPTLLLWVWVPEAVLLEQRPDSLRRGVWVAVRRSQRLVGHGSSAALAGSVGSLFLALWFAGLAEACGSTCMGFLLQFGAPFGSPWDLQATPWILFGLLVAQPIIGAYRLLLYVDTRTRSEGWDLQVALRALGLP